MLLLSLSGCGYTIEEKRLMKEYEKTGKENAITYIEGKYGFTPVVDGVECFTMGIEFKIDFTPPPTGDVFVKMKNEEKNLEFWVYTTGEESNQEKCWDNYQHKEIDEAIENQLKTLLGVDIKHLGIAYGMFNSEGISVDGNISMYKKYGLVHDYFDGDNLAEVLNHTEGNKILACIIAEKHIPDLMDCSIGEFIERGIYEGDVAEGEKLIQVIGENTNCMIVNYKDQESCNLAHQQKEISHDIHYPDFKGCVDDLYFFMKDHYYLIGKHRSKNLHYEYAKYEVKQYDNLYYTLIRETNF